VKTLFLDTETFCEVPITNGTHAYAERAEVMLVPYAWNDDEPVVLDLTVDATLAQVQALVDEADEIVIHNSPFDRTVLRWSGVDVPIEKVHDTMVWALEHSLPASLGTLCEVLGLPADKAKDKAGKRLIQLFCKPRPKNMKLRRAWLDSHPQEWEDFKAYAASDIISMREVRKLLPKWNEGHAERSLWLLDQVMNERGIAVDQDLATAALRAFQRTSASLAVETAALTNGAVTSLTQRGRMLTYLDEEHDFVPLDMTKGTVNAYLKEGAAPLSDEVRKLLEIRQQVAATSPSKYKALLGAVSSDGRLRGTIQFCGASRTGRDAGRIFQPQNLPRPVLDADVIETGIEAMKADCEDLIWENVSELCTSAVRGCLVAPPGRKLVVADLSNIEGRVLAWLAGESWKLQAFRDYDAGIGEDLYKIAAGRILGKPAADVTKAERQVSGKVPELSCGYGGSVGAFSTMGALYGVNLPEDQVVLIVRAWRKAHRAVVSFWYDVEAAAKSALKDPSSSFKVRGLTFDVRSHGPFSWLRMRLPSGRYLCYPGARVEGSCEPCAGSGKVLVGGFVEDGGAAHYEICPTCHGSGKNRSGLNSVVYLGTNQYTRKWEELRTYGGKLVENATQAVARDVLMHGVRLAEAGGYGVVMRVHDELLCETPDSEDFTVEGLSACMSRVPAWAIGLPLAAAGFETHRYRKDG
jgi:DNA polymerase